MHTLQELKSGQSCIIKKVTGDDAFRCKMADMGVLPGTVVCMQQCAPGGDTLKICLRGYTLTMRRAQAQQIEIIGVMA